MRVENLALLLFLVSIAVMPAAANAQTPRDVLLDVCNESPVTVATAAAYRTSPADSRTLRTWFLVQPGTCLEGALNNVVGDDVDLHVMSGEFFWPAGEGDVAHCVPAGSTTSLVSSPPCAGANTDRAFRRVPIETTGLRGPGGRNYGRVNWRVRCGDLDLIDAGLCSGAPRNAQGLAQPVRTLEVCNIGRRTASVAVTGAPEGPNVTVLARAELGRDECRNVYRGYPFANTLLVADVGRTFRDQDGEVCLPEHDSVGEMSSDGGCGSDHRRASGFTIVSFRENVGRFTAYVGR